MGSNPGHSLMLVSISSNLHRLLDRVPWCLGPWCGGISPPTYRPELIKNDEQGYMRSKVGSIVQNACEDIGEYGQWCKWIKRDPHSTGTGCASGAGRLTLVNMFINSVRDKVVHTQVHVAHPSYLGLHPVSGRMSYRKIAWSLEAGRFEFGVFKWLWNLRGTSAVALPRCLSSFRATIQHPISRHRGFAIFGDKIIEAWTCALPRPTLSLSRMVSIVWFRFFMI